MRRREFIAGLGGAAAWPVAARAQQQPALPMVGFLRSTDASGSAHLVAAFRRGLSEVGIIEGQNVDLVYRYADGKRDRLKDLAAELVRRNVTVIVANTAAARAAKASSAAVPIVFVTGSDPVRLGLVNSFNRPGGNVTGVVFTVGDLTAKRLSLLHEMIPNSGKIAVLFDPNTPAQEAELREVEQARHVIGRDIVLIKAAAVDELPAAFATMIQAGAVALLIGAGAFFLNNRTQLVSLAGRHALPASFVTRQYPEVGGLMSYGPSQTDSYRQAGVYAGRILKGDKPSDLPVLQPTKFELVINLKTAKALGITVPATLLARADEVIE
jgi:putative ABC transport system substrate-binding protein